MKINSMFLKRLWLIPGLLIATFTIWGIVLLPKAGSDWTIWDNDGYINTVFEGGPADQAGLRAGDVLVAFNDCYVLKWGLCGEPIFHTGDIIHVTYIRAGQTYETEMTLRTMHRGDLIARASVLVVAFSFCFVSIITYLGKPEKSEIRLFYIMSQLGAAYLTGNIYTQMNYTFIFGRLGLLIGMLTPTMIHFHATFPELRWLAKQRWALRFLYIVGAIITFFRFLRPMILFPPIIIDQTIGYLWLLFGFVVSIFMLVRTYTITAFAEARRRIRLLVIGSMIAFLPIIIFTVVPTIFLDGGRDLSAWRYTIPLLIFIPISYSLALRQYNLIKFDHTLNRGLVYFLVSSIFLALFFVSLWLLYNLLPVNLLSRAISGAGIALIAVFLFHPLRIMIQRLVDRLFYGGWYDYRGLEAEMGQALASSTDYRTIINILVDKVPRAMHLPGAELWLDKRNVMFQVRKSGPELPEARSIVRQDPIPTEVIINDKFAAAPLMVKDQVIGMWFLSGRQSEEWGVDEKSILTALARQAALAVFNLYLMGDLRDKIGEVERAHHQLLSAREEERSELARELHDGIIQDLIGLRYRLEEIQEQGGKSDHLLDVYAQVGILIGELRRLCSDLRPPSLDQLGLAAALRALAREITERGLPVETCLEDLLLPDEVATSLYRISQEALSNAWRHAKAKKASICLSREGNEIMLTIADDGQGFNPSNGLEKSGHFGLLNMIERAQAMGAQLNIDSEPGKGTLISVQYDSEGFLQPEEHE